MSLLSNFNNKELSFLIYIIIINIVSFIVFGLDKFKSKNGQWRISEATFMILALLGGSTSILIGMVMFKHKISKKKFAIGIPLIFLINRILEIIFVNYLKGL